MGYSTGSHLNQLLPPICFPSIFESGQIADKLPALLILTGCPGASSEFPFMLPKPAVRVCAGADVGPIGGGIPEEIDIPHLKYA